MDAGNLIVLLLAVGGLFAMFAMHRGGGHSHAAGGHSHGGGQGASEEPRTEEKQPVLGKPGSKGHEHGAAVADGKHKGCC